VLSTEQREWAVGQGAGSRQTSNHGFAAYCQLLTAHFSERSALCRFCSARIGETLGFSFRIEFACDVFAKGILRDLTNRSGWEAFHHFQTFRKLEFGDSPSLEEVA